MKKSGNSVKTPIWTVRKFVPTCCPNCANDFKKNKEGKGGWLISLYWKYAPDKVREKIMASCRHPKLKLDVIICGTCHNVTQRVMLEERTYDKLEDAERAIRDEGFSGPEEGVYFGPPSNFKNYIRTEKYL